MKVDGSGRKIASQATRQSGQFPKKCFLRMGLIRIWKRSVIPWTDPVISWIGLGAAIPERSFLK
nr:hypothetical protein [uncultured Clostridium sp.]